MASFLTGSRAARSRALAQSALAWWRAEFVNLWPQRIAASLFGDSQPRMIVARDADVVRLRLTDARSGLNIVETSSAGAVSEAIEPLLERCGLNPRDVDVGMQLPQDQVFQRDLVLPGEARSAIDAIVPQDLLRRTPFKADDIYSDHVTNALPDGRIAVRQWVTRRQPVLCAAADLGLPIERIAFATFGDGEEAPTIRLARKAAARRPHRMAIIALCCLAAVLGLALGGLTYVRQQAALDQLDAEIAVARRSAERVRGAMDQLRERRTALSRLRLQKSELPGLIDVWNETTRIIPRHSWLTELRLAEAANGRGASVTMTGFSAAAPSLVNILDESRIFVDAALTSPVAMDPIEGRERFSLQARLRVPDGPKEIKP